jgi:hypothetical protein
MCRKAKRDMRRVLDVLYAMVFRVNIDRLLCDDCAGFSPSPDASWLRRPL